MIVRAAMARRSSSGDARDDDELDSPSSIETGHLAIDVANANNPKDLWIRPLRRPILPNGETLRFEIRYARVLPPEGENINIKRYIIYDLLVRKDCKKIDPLPATIERRYTDFLNLYTNLRKDQPELMQKVVFPKKVLIGNFSTDLIAERGSAFEIMLDYISSSSILRESPHFLYFLQNNELAKAGQLLDERRNELAIPILENCFKLLNNIFLDRSRPVLLALCRLVAACTTPPVPHPSAEKWAELALRRYEGVSDADLLSLYIPLLHTCSHLWWQRGRDKDLITDRLNDMSKKGIKVSGGMNLTQAIHLLDPRTETF